MTYHGGPTYGKVYGEIVVASEHHLELGHRHMTMFLEKLFVLLSIILSWNTATYHKCLPSTTPFKYSSPVCTQVCFRR
jgi:hypothetical protein